MLGIYGKHPDFGDFIAAGFSDTVTDALTGWLETVLPISRDAMGPAWENIFDAAAEVRFWIGGAVFGSPVCGIMRASRDKVGRRFPLVLGMEGTGHLPPVLDTDPALYNGLSAHLHQAKSDADRGGAGLLAGYAGLMPEGVLPDSDQIWAIRQTGTAQDLLASISTADHLRLATTRSYWWNEGAPGRAPILHACSGLPDAQALTWFVTGVAAEEVQEPEAVRDE